MEAAGTRRLEPLRLFQNSSYFGVDARGARELSITRNKAPWSAQWLEADDGACILVHIDGAGMRQGMAAAADEAAHPERPRRRRILWIIESPEYTHGATEALLNEYAPALAGLFEAVWTYDARIVARGIPNVKDARLTMGTWITASEGGTHWEKTKAVSMVVSGKAETAEQKARTTWAVAHAAEVELFGRGHRPIASKAEALQAFMFSVAWENSVSPGYVTEKLHDVIACGAAPIYRGDARRAAELYDPRGILFWDDFIALGGAAACTPALYAAMRPFVKANYERLRGYACLEDAVLPLVLPHERDWDAMRPPCDWPPAADPLPPVLTLPPPPAAVTLPHAPELDLRAPSVRVVVITAPATPKYAARADAMRALMARAGIRATFFEAGTDYPCALTRATMDIMRAHLAEYDADGASATSPRSMRPLVILEDDVEWDGRASVEVPPAADMLYLGVSALAIDPFSSWDDPDTSREVGKRFKRTHCRGVVRVLNMLSAHAVAYLTPDVLRVLIPLLQYGMDVTREERHDCTVGWGEGGTRRLMNDVLLARMQPIFAAYAANPPLFWQSATADGALTTAAQRQTSKETKIQFGDAHNGFLSYKAVAR